MEKKKIIAMLLALSVITTVAFTGCSDDSESSSADAGDGYSDDYEGENYGGDEFEDGDAENEEEYADDENSEDGDYEDEDENTVDQDNDSFVPGAGINGNASPVSPDDLSIQPSENSQQGGNGNQQVDPNSAGIAPQQNAGGNQLQWWNSMNPNWRREDWQPNPYDPSVVQIYDAGTGNIIQYRESTNLFACWMPGATQALYWDPYTRQWETADVYNANIAAYQQQR